MKNKLFIITQVILFGFIVSYVAFGWEEPEGEMPSEYIIPINTSAEIQSVSEDKPVITNLNADMLGGYHVSDLLANSPDASFHSVQGTSCPAGEILMSRHYKSNECHVPETYCDATEYSCDWHTNFYYITSPSGWSPSATSTTRWVYSNGCSMIDGYCKHTNPAWKLECKSINDYVLCMKINEPE